MNEAEEVSIFRQTISEADIDWLFCVELNACREFRLWAASRLFHEHEIDGFEHDRAWRSVSNSAGESDIIWRIKSSAGEFVICLIENKINAVAQPSQYNRYIVRGNTYVEKGFCQAFHVALIAPEQFSSNDSDAYPHRISYEDIAQWFRSRSDQRSQYLAGIYDTAIKKHGLSAPIDIDEDMTLFQESIWRLANAEFPQLTVPTPKGKNAKSDWVYMRYHTYTIIYKMKKTSGTYGGCMVDLQLDECGHDVEALKEQYKSMLELNGITVEKTGESASFRLQVPAIVPPHYDEAKVREALKAAAKLKAWWDSMPIQITKT